MKENTDRRPIKLEVIVNQSCGKRLDECKEICIDRCKFDKILSVSRVNSDCYVMTQRVDDYEI